MGNKNKATNPAGRFLGKEMRWPAAIAKNFLLFLQPFLHLLPYDTALYIAGHRHDFYMSLQSEQRLPKAETNFRESKVTMNFGTYRIRTEQGSPIPALIVLDVISVGYKVAEGDVEVL